MVSADVPAAALPELMVKVELPPEVTEAGLNDALAPVGRPETLRFTVCALPEVTAVLMVVLPLPPAVTVTALGLAPMEKSLVTVSPQPGNLKVPTRVAQLKAPFEGRYSVVYQKV